jgi:SAM-dependent methyltransferase
MQEAIGTSEYWDKRVIENKNDEIGMIMRDSRIYEYTKRVNEILSSWKDKKVLDLCCGYGRYSEHFSKYLGVDFSKEMIALAKSKYDKEFVVADIKEYRTGELYDVIFEVNSLHSLGMTEEDFFNKFKAPIVACLEMDKFTIKQGY